MSRTSRGWVVGGGALLLWWFAGAGCQAADAASPGCARAEVERGRRIVHSLTVDGVERQYILDVPDSVRAGAPAALLFDFHGFGHSGAGVWQVSRFKQLADGGGFITVYPEGLPIRLLGRDPKPGWEIERVDGNRDLALVRALLDRLESEYCIDRDRVYATGFSNGAFFSHLLGCVMSERFAAIAPVGGGGPLVACEPGRAVPVSIHHGRQDQIVPLARAQAARDGWRERNGCGVADASGACLRYRDCRDGGEVEYCEADVGHSWPEPATERIWRFFEAHPRRR